MALSTTAPLPKATFDKVHSRFGISVRQVYGIIEVGLPCGNMSDPVDRWDSVGRAFPSYEVKLVRQEQYRDIGESCGEVRVRGRGFFDAYYDPWVSAADVLQDGWFSTGDVGEIDGEGFLFLRGRINGVINVSGMKVFPEEVEGALNSHPSVRESRVYPHRHAHLGQVVEADVVVRTPDAAPDEDELRMYCRPSSKLGRRSLPTYSRFLRQGRPGGSGRRCRTGRSTGENGQPCRSSGIISWNRAMRIRSRLFAIICSRCLPKGADRVSFVPSLESEVLTIKLNLGTVARKAQSVIGMASDLLAFLKANVPEFGRAHLSSRISPVLNRTSRRLRGHYVLTGGDVMNASKFKDGMVRCSWPVEMWGAGGRPKFQYIDPGQYYEIPAGSLAAQCLDNLFVAGRCISADDKAIASARVVGACLATGEAAAALGEKVLCATAQPTRSTPHSFGTLPDQARADTPSIGLSRRLAISKLP